MIIVFSYQDLIKKLILALKYYHKSDIADFLAERLVLATMSNKALPDQFRISYVPSHRFRNYFTKGYNQSKLLAQEFSRKTGLPLVDLTKKIRSTHTQAGLNRAQRLANLENAFQAKTQKTCPDLVGVGSNDTVLIIDDVTTTGTTINEIAKTMKSQSPQAKIRGVVLARNNK